MPLAYTKPQSLQSWETQASGHRDLRDKFASLFGQSSEQVIGNRSINPITGQVDTTWEDILWARSNPEMNLEAEKYRQANMREKAGELLALDPSFKIDHTTTDAKVNLAKKRAIGQDNIDQTVKLQKVLFNLPEAKYARDASTLSANRTHQLALADRADLRTDAAANRLHEIELQEGRQNAARNQWLEQVAYLDRKDEQKKLEADQMLRFMALRGGLELVAELMV